jgi:hypothetical protein
MDEKFSRNVDDALGNTPGKEPPEAPRLGGKPGEPVPVVDPEDLKTAWQISRDAQTRNHGNGVAVGFELMQRLSKPGADIQAVGYRATLIWMMGHIAPERFARFMREGEPDETVFRAAAKVPVEWIGVGISRQGPPFDVDEFLRLCGEETEPA